MTRAQQRREQVVGKYHRNMMISALATAVGGGIGIILVIAWAPQLDDMGNELAYWLIGLPPATAVSLFIFYFLFIIAFTFWIQYKRHEH